MTKGNSEFGKMDIPVPTQERGNQVDSATCLLSKWLQPRQGLYRW